MILRNTCVNRPSFHSRVVWSKVPYNASFDTALGSITYETPSTPSRRSKAASRTCQAWVLPVPDGPTSIRPCEIF